MLSNKQKHNHYIRRYILKETYTSYKKKITHKCPHHIIYQAQLCYLTNKKTTPSYHLTNTIMLYDKQKYKPIISSNKHNDHGNYLTNKRTSNKHNHAI